MKDKEETEKQSCDGDRVDLFKKNRSDSQREKGCVSLSAYYSHNHVIETVMMIKDKCDASLLM